MLLAEIAEVSRAVAGTSARLTKIETLARALRQAGPLEVPIAVAYLSGELPQRQIGVGWAALRDGFPAADVPTLTLSDVDSGFSAIGAVSGKGSAAARKALVGELFGRATADEQRFLYGLLSGELRQGALEGVMTEAVARAAAVPVADVRRAMMLRGSLGAVAAAALAGGSEALRAFGLEVGRPVRPMLAASAPRLDEALSKAGGAKPGGEAAVEWKLDGIRIQAHLSGGTVRLFTRTLDEITARLPDVAAVLAKLPVRTAVLDGELIALREDGRPLPFQDTASRTASQDGPAVPLSVFLFDALHADGVDLIDLPYAGRHGALAAFVPPELLMPRAVTSSVEEAADFLAGALARGHEGVVVKALSAPYAAGRRGAGWIKVKPRHTLDLVVLAVEWGHGRRRGWLSNLHLGARDPSTGGFVMLGKTFKGLTDELLTWQTERLLALAERQDSYTVYVRPELVVEIAFDGVQRSPRYPGGLALRFARVLRYRDDKTAAEADTIDTVRALHPGPGSALPRDLVHFGVISGAFVHKIMAAAPAGRRWSIAHRGDSGRASSTGAWSARRQSTGHGRSQPGPGSVSEPMSMHGNSVDAWSDIAEFRVGVVMRKQVLRAGMSRNVVRRRLASGKWRRLRRGVYATFSGPLPRQAEWWAAVLRAGPGATLSHHTAAELHGLTDKPSEQIHVTVPATRNPARLGKVSGVVIHRSSRIDAARHPALSPPRTRVEDTVLDLVETARDFHEAFAWICRAVGRRRTTAPLLAAAVAARKRMRWRSELTAALTDVADGVHSVLERRYVTGVERAHGLPRATRQAKRRHGDRHTYIDNLYEEFDLCVEVDGASAHPADERWEDVRRDNANTACGTATLRFGWPDATEDRCHCAILVGDTLRRRGWQGTVRPCSPGCPAGTS